MILIFYDDVQNIIHPIISFATVSAPGKILKIKAPNILISPFNKKRIAIFASGAGSNAKQFIQYFNEHSSIEVALIVTNNPYAGVIDIAHAAKIPVMLISKNDFNASGYADALRKAAIDYIVLAGFLWKVPPVLIQSFPDRIINIHPALLPSYGGKGMYGKAVHRAVIAAKEKESGITIHFVDEHYDHGKIILQKRIPLLPAETEESLAKKIQALEHEHFASAIEKLILEN